ncbi:MAG: DMSO reductase [Gammaproteobacteria bacterium]|nr:MAG: DMSO reductase [Gammaproteobacteria bacterium]
MRPAFSVIFLTTLIGVGQGLFLALFTGQIYSLAKLLPAQDSRVFYATGSAVALTFLVLGLAASVFHLGRPERAWRSAAKWRSSWLSREVIILPITLFLVFLYGALHYFGYTEPLFVIQGSLPVDPTLIVGVLATISTFLLFLCTGMIYASLRFLQEWHSALTVFNYILLGAASGFMLATAYSALLDIHLVGFYGAWAVVLTLAAFISRMASLMRNRTIKRKSSIQSAIGVRHNRIVQESQGFMGGSFNTREFFHGKSRLMLKWVKHGFIVLTFFVPVVLVGIAYRNSSETLALWAFVVQYIGLLMERWYFFADASHPQNIYYQSIA